MLNDLKTKTSVALVVLLGIVVILTWIFVARIYREQKDNAPVADANNLAASVTEKPESEPYIPETYDIPLDEFTCKQWYLYDGYHCEIEINPDAPKPTSGFQMNNTLSIDSTFDLGICSFWNSGVTYSGDKAVVVALIDSSVDISHEDLRQNIWQNENEILDDGIDNDGNGYIDDCYGWNFIDNSNDVDKNIDEFSHGTHCAGIIAAEHNDIGVMGIAGNTNIKIMALPAIEKGEDDQEIQNVINAIRYAERMGAQICNLSCSFSEYSTELEEVMKSSKMVFVVSAGNFENGFIQGLNIDETKRYPASFNLPNVVTVGNLDIDDELAPDSNYGPGTVDIAAPGEWIYSTLPHDTYGFMSGTSMAAPVVTSVLALYYLCSDADMAQAVQMLYQNAQCSNSLSEEIVNRRTVHFTDQQNNKLNYK